MKVFIKSSGMDLSGLAFHMVKEGNEVVDEPSEAELVLTDDSTLKGPKRTVYGGFWLPRICLEEAGFDLGEPNARSSYTLSRWFEKDKWLDQTVVGFPLVGLMDGDLGPQVPAGFAMRFMQRPAGSDVFENGGLIKILREMGHVGFVTFPMSQGGPVGIQIGLPEYAIYPIMECNKTGIAEWFMSPSRLLESWVCGVLVSREPFPYKLPPLNKCELRLGQNDMRHTWPLQVEQARKSTVLWGNKVCVATGWHQNLSEAAKRLYRTCDRIEVPCKQYRLDIAERTTSALGELMLNGGL